MLELPLRCSRILAIIPQTPVARFASFVQRSRKCAEKVRKVCFLEGAGCAAGTRRSSRQLGHSFRGLPELVRAGGEMMVVRRSGAGSRRFPLPLFTQAQSSIPLRRPADPVPAASCGRAGAQHRVRGPGGEPELEGHFNWRWYFPTSSKTVFSFKSWTTKVRDVYFMVVGMETKSITIRRWVGGL